MGGTICSDFPEKASPYVMNNNNESVSIVPETYFRYFNLFSDQMKTDFNISIIENLDERKRLSQSECQDILCRDLIG